MPLPSQFTDEEAALMADQHFFLTKAQIMAKVRRLLTATHAALKEEVASARSRDPAGLQSRQPSLCEGRVIWNSFPTNIWTFQNTSTTRTLLPFERSFGGGTTSYAP